MLSLGLLENQFVVIGDTLVQVQEIRKGKVRLAIAATPDLALLRLDAQGKPLGSLARKVTRTITQADVPWIPRGEADLVLTCGHVVRGLADRSAGAVECPKCKTLAESFISHIQHLQQEGRGR